jgi:hypothetical protein
VTRLLEAILVRLGGEVEPGSAGQEIAPLGAAWEADLWTLARQASPEADVWDALAAELEEEA